MVGLIGRHDDFERPTLDELLTDLQVRLGLGPVA